MGCSCCTSSIADGTITQSEHDAKVYNLQCRFKDYVVNITDRWRYGIFCLEDSDTLVEIRSLLRLLICYGKETEEISDDSQVPGCYNNYIRNGGNNWNEYPVSATVNIGDYFFVTSPVTGNYYILGGVEGYSAYWPPMNTVLSPFLNDYIYQLDNGATTLTWGTPNTGGEYYKVRLICSGLQSDLDNALQAAAGVTVTSSGLSDANLLLITEKIEKLLAC
jgi:hypothetical protein